MAKITLKKDHSIEIKVGAFEPLIIGTWKKEVSYEHQGNDHNLYRMELYVATLKNGQRIYGDSFKGLRKQLIITI